MKIKTNRYSVLGNYFLSLVIIGLVFIPIYSKGELELTINQFHHPFFDSIFSLVTHLGDGIILVIPLVILLFYKSCHFVLLTLASAFHLGLVHVGKKWLFQGMPRPAEFFKDIPFHEVPGVTLHHWGSFPSGHTATAFMLASFFYLVLPKKFRLHSLLMGIAFSVGFSRVYLMQHFFVDIWAGALIGLFSTGLAYLIVLKIFAKRRYQKPVMRRLNLQILN